MIPPAVTPIIDLRPSFKWTGPLPCVPNDNLRPLTQVRRNARKPVLEQLRKSVDLLSLRDADFAWCDCGDHAFPASVHARKADLQPVAAALLSRACEGP